MILVEILQAVTPQIFCLFLRHTFSQYNLLYVIGVECRVLARISEMPVQNSNFKSFAHPVLATNPLQILIPVSTRAIYTSSMSWNMVC